MQINTRISTVITLDQSEIEEAITAYIKTRTPTAVDDAKFSIVFEDEEDGGDLTATILVDAVLQENAEPKPAKKPRAPRAVATSPAPITTPEPENLPGSPVVGGDDEKPNLQTNPEDRRDPNNPDDTDPPFEVDPPKEEPVKEAEKPAVTETPKIFTQINTSAAPTPPPPKADPAVAAKSLFANLSRPGN